MEERVERSNYKTFKKFHPWVLNDDSNKNNNKTIKLKTIRFATHGIPPFTLLLLAR